MRISPVGGEHGLFEETRAVICNACPWCASTFASKQSAVQHVRNAVIRNKCVCDLNFFNSKLVPPTDIECPICDVMCDSVEEYNWHMRALVPDPNLHSEFAVSLLRVLRST